MTSMSRRRGPLFSLSLSCFLQAEYHGKWFLDLLDQEEEGKYREWWSRKIKKVWVPHEFV